MNTTASEIMERNILTISGDHSMAEAASLLLSHAINSMPVLDGGGAVAGVVSIRDVLRVPLASHSGGRILRYDRLEEKARLLCTTRVDQVMNRHFLGVDGEEFVTDIAASMADRGVHPVLVLDGGTLVGLIARADIARLLLGLSEDSTLQPALVGY